MFHNNEHRTSYKRYFVPVTETKDYNVMIYGQDAFDQPVRNDSKTHESIWKISTGQGDDYTIGCLLDFLISKNNVSWWQ